MVVAHRQSTAQNREPRSSATTLTRRPSFFYQATKHIRRENKVFPPPENGVGMIGYVFKEGKLNSYLENIGENFCDFGDKQRFLNRTQIYVYKQDPS